MSMKGLSIGDVAHRAGLRASALRYYEQVGLIAPQPRASGRRQYDPGVFNVLAVIDQAKRAGFTIAETKLLLTGFGADVPASARWRSMAGRKQAELDEVIVNARRMKNLLHMSLRCKCMTLEECGRLLVRRGGKAVTQGR
jgi:MerR family transcriptional regulator, redox-sensitive transcriptional activator SoxR